MIAAHLFMLALSGILGVLAVRGLHLRRRAVRPLVVALGASLAVATGITALVQLGWIPAAATVVALFAGVLAHPLLAASTEALLSPRRPALWKTAALVGAGVPVAGAAAYFRIPFDALYGVFPFNLYLGGCVGLAVGAAVLALLGKREGSSHALPLLHAAVLFLISGPVYAYEVEAVGFPDLVGYLPLAPVVLFLVVESARKVDAYPLGLRRQAPVLGAIRYRLPTGKVLFLAETRSKYARAAFASGVDGGLPSLLITSDEALQARRSSPTDAIPLKTDATGRTRLVHTAFEFSARTGRGIIYLEDFGELLANAGPEAALSTVRQMERAVRGTGITFLVSASLLTKEEIETLPAKGFEVLGLPDVEVEAAAVLRQTVGGEALLQAYATHTQRRLEDLDLRDLPLLRDFLRGMYERLAPEAGAAGTGALEDALRDLERLQNLEITDLARGDWPSRRAWAPPPVLVTTAPAADAPPPPEPLYPAVERAFVDAFGEVGRNLAARELTRLHLAPHTLTRADVLRLREQVRDMRLLLLAAVDTDGARALMRDRQEALEHSLKQIAGGHA